MSDDSHFDAAEGVDERDIAIIGMAGRFPGAADLDQLWQLLKNGVEAVSPLSDDQLTAAGVAPEDLADPSYVKAASLLDGVELFDADFFGYSPREAEMLDPQQRLFLEQAWAALEDAGCVPAAYDGTIGVYAGVAWNTYLLNNLTPHRELFDGADAFQALITGDKDFMPTRLSYKLNLKGPSVLVQTSCSTSLTAVHLAALSLLSYECDVALVGGVTVKVPQHSGYHHQTGGLASPDGHCRAFDAQGAGTIFGSGVGVVVLKRLSEALAEGDRIRAVIKGSAINNDGSAKVSYTAPSVEGQAEVIAAALEMADVEPESIGYVEGHGTGTALGDPIEVTALTRVFRESTTKRGFCGLGSIKTNFGHLDAASGVAGLIKTVLALEHRQLPPSLHFERPNPEIDFEASPFYVNATLADWSANGTPRRAGVSSFGVGGTNAHVIVEEASQPAPSSSSRPWQLLLLSAKTETALTTASQDLASHLRRENTTADNASLADVAYTLRRGRTVFRHRRALVCRDRLEAAEALEGETSSQLFTAVDPEDPGARPVAFLFSGQGTQYLGMGRGLYEEEAVFRQHLDHCAEVLLEPLDLDLRWLLYPPAGSEEDAARQLANTRFTQPALFAIEYATARLAMAWGIQPGAMLGHSIGEWVAACLAGVVDLDDALHLVAARGRLMSQQPEGAMLTVALSEADVRESLIGRDELSLAAFNEPSRVVVAGPNAALSDFERELGRRMVQCRRLHTSHAFHSPMMEAAVEPFAAEVRQVALSEPEIPFLSNLTGTWITAEQATDPDYWGQQLRQPVRFADGVGELLREPRQILFEIGPGRTLCGLATRHPDFQGQVAVPSLPGPRDEADDSATLLAGVGRLWLAGVELDDEGFYGDETRRRVGLPTYPFERQRYWIEAGAAPAKSVDLKAVNSGLGKQQDLADWFYLPSFRRSLPLPVTDSLAPQDPASTWLIFADPFGVGSALAEKLRQGDRTAITVEAGAGLQQRAEQTWTIDPSRAEDYESLIEALEQRGEYPRHVVHAWSLTDEAPSAHDAEAFEAAQRLGFSSLRGLGRALAGKPGSEADPDGDEVDLTILSNVLLAITDGEALRPEKATLLGLARVLPQELPRLTCRVLDLDFERQPTERLAERVIAEVDAAAGDAVVAYRGDGRWLESFEPAPLVSPASPPWRQGGCYLLTGGLDGDGFALARLLADAGARLALLEAEPISTEVAWQGRVRDLERRGAEVRVFTANLSDAAQVGVAVAEAEARFGNLDGVLHAAGATGEKSFRALRETGAEECSWHFAPKVHGLYALDQALAGRHLDFRVVMSSLAATLGGLAYGAYASANAFLGAFATASGGTWRAIDWDVWLHDDDSERITTVRRDLAELAMTREEGEEAFARAVATAGVERILVSTADLGARFEHGRRRIDSLRQRESGARPEAGGAHPRPALATNYVAPESDLERQLAEVWGGVLGFERIGVLDNFFDLGGDSLLALKVVERLNQSLEIDLPVAKLYQGLTVRALAEVIEESGERGREQRRDELEERRQAMDRRREYQRSRRSARGVAVR